MTTSDIMRQRLLRQQLSRPEWSDPASVVRWLGAVQSQDFAGAKWALGQRAPGATEATIAAAYDSGAILRTHVLRPTWHFVDPADIRWMLALTGPRVLALMAGPNRKLGLDDAVLRRSRTVLEHALRDSEFLERGQLKPALQQAGIPTDENRFSHVLMDAELHGLICSGPRRGKQFTYALLEARVAPAPAKHPEEMLAELTLRYFNSHGPATVKDFVWWSGLTVADARSGLGLAGKQLLHETVDGEIYWFAPPPAGFEALSQQPVAHLLPMYDEYTVAYRDRGIVLDPRHAEQTGNGIFKPVVLVDGKIVGSWKALPGKGHLELRTEILVPLDAAERTAIQDAANGYGYFAGKPAKPGTF